MGILVDFLLGFVVGTGIRTAAIWLVGSAFMLEESKGKAFGIAIITSITAFILSYVPILGSFSIIPLTIIEFFLFKALYDAGTGGALGGALLVETVTGGIIYGILFVVSAIGI